MATQRITKRKTSKASAKPATKPRARKNTALKQKLMAEFNVEEKTRIDGTRCFYAPADCPADVLEKIKAL
jgi:hypothetical protein